MDSLLVPEFNRQVRIIKITRMTTSISSRSSKKSDLYINQGPRKSRFPLNLTNRQTYGRTDEHSFATKKYLPCKSRGRCLMLCYNTLQRNISSFKHPAILNSLILQIHIRSQQAKMKLIKIIGSREQGYRDRTSDKKLFKAYSTTA